MEMYKNAGFTDNMRKFSSTSKPVGTAGKAKTPVESNTTNTVPVFGPKSERQRSTGRPNIKEMLSKQYVFRRDLVKSLFEQMNERQLLTLPNPSRPDQVSMTDNPLYCPYHRYVGHVIEDCIVFKEWLQRAIDEKRLALKPEALNPDYHTSNVITVQQDSSMTVYINEEEEYWVPFSQVGKQFEELCLTPLGQDARQQSWQQVQQRRPSLV